MPGPNFTRALGIEGLYLFTLLVIGYFSGAFRTPIWAPRPDREQEIASVNNALSSRGAPPTDGAGYVTREDVGDKNIDTDGPVARSIILPLFESARLGQSIAGGILLYVMSGNLPYSLAFSVLLAWSYLFNDIFDYLSGKDLLSHPKRPLPSGRLSLIAASLACVGLSFVFVVQLASMRDVETQLVLAGGIAVSGAYSLLLKRLLPAIATPIWGTMVVSVFLWVLSAPLLSYVLCLSYFLGRELLLDIRDEAADKTFARLPSLATILGSSARGLSMFMMVFPVVALIWVSSSNQALVLLAVAAFSLALLVTCRNQKRLELTSKAGYLLVFLLPMS